MVAVIPSYLKQQRNFIKIKESVTRHLQLISRPKAKLASPPYWKLDFKKMQKLKIALIYFWGISLVSCSSFEYKRPILSNPSRGYAHGKESSVRIYDKISSIPTTSSTTESSRDICNSSNLDEPQTLRRKRSNFYFQISSTTAAVPSVRSQPVLSESFLNCLLTTVEPECYVLFPNGSVYVPLYDRFFDRSNYLISEGDLLVCPDFFDIVKEKFPSAIGTVSIICVVISAVFIILHIIMFLLVEKLRNLPGYCLFSLCISLLMAYTNMVIHYYVSEHAECKVIGLLLMYSFLSSFFWMNVISFDVWRSIRQATSQLLLSSGRSIKFRFTAYSCYGWGFPLSIMIIALVVDRVSDRDEYRLLFNVDTCWFRYRQALLVYFALPLFVVLTLNTFFFFSSFHMITRSRSDSGCQEAYDLRSQLFLTLRLGTVMGLMWIFGVIDAVTDQEWISYLQSACNALQGVFIFFSFNFNQRTKKACKEAIRKKKSSLISLTSPFHHQTKKPLR